MMRTGNYTVLDQNPGKEFRDFGDVFTITEIENGKV